MSLARVLVVGSLNIDLVVRASRLPGPGETVLGGDMVLAEGGKGANQAVAAARSGAEVVMKGCVGDDAFGRRLVSVLACSGVDASGVATTGMPTGAASIWVEPGGENRIIVVPGANAEVTPALARRWALEVGKGDIVLVQMEIPPESTREVIAVAARRGGRVVLDPAPVPEDGFVEGMLRGVFVVTPNAQEASRLTSIEVIDPGSACVAGRVLVERGTSAACVTLGGEGAVLVTAGGAWWYPPFAVDAADTTAAGDAFNGALAAALARGVPLERCVRDASAAGALASTVVGAQPSLPGRDIVAGFTDERRGEGWPEMCRV